MRRHPTLALILFVLTCAAGCASTQPAPASDPALDLAQAPAWVHAARDAEHVMSALGTASGIDDPGALRRTALGNARAALSTQIASRLGEILGSGPDAIAAVDAVVAISLYGPHGEHYWVGPSGTCYVRYEIPVAVYRSNVASLSRLDDALRTTVVAATWSDADARLAR